MSGGRSRGSAARGLEGLLGVVLVAIGIGGFDWRLGGMAAGVLLYLAAGWGR